MPTMIRAGQGVVLVVIALLTLGVVMVNSAGLTVGSGRSLDVGQILSGRTTLLAGLAVAMMLLGSWLPLGRLYRARRAASPVLWITLGVLLLLVAVHLPVIGREVNGARRWINLFGLSFQPSEAAKWGVLFILAAHAAQRPRSMGRLVTGLLPPMAIVAVFCGLIATEDLGTAMLIGVVSVAVMLAGGARLLHALGLGVAALGGFAAAVMSSPYRIDRLRAFLDPHQDPQGIGYHLIHSLATVAGGGVSGRGLGNSIQKFGYLPEDTTDFIFAVICEELGLVGAIVVIALYAALLLLGWSIVRRAEHPFPRLLGLGILLTVGLQALFNMAVVTGLVPTKGIALPLVSAGGTGWVLVAFSLGVLVSISRTSPDEFEQKALRVPIRMNRRTEPERSRNP